MSEPEPLSYSNHRKFVPAYHYLGTTLVLLVLLWSLYRVIFHFSLDSVAGLCLTIALLIIAGYARIFALGVQDRLIVLEQKLRLAKLLPEELAARVGELRKGQMVGLRFASDDEVGDLVERCLNGELRGGEAVKKAIKTWQSDPLRI